MYGAFMVVGWRASRKVREGTAADLIVAGRRMPLWIAALTMTATWVDGGYLLGTTEGAYKSSIQLGIQGGLCFGISLILGGVFFAGVMRRFGCTTLIDPFEARFGRRWAAVLFLPALQPHGGLWTSRSVVGWWDVSLMLMFGGIPWNCYFQRVLSCRTPRDARRMSSLAGVLTIVFTVPPLMMGVAAFAYPWPPDLVTRLHATPADAMPLLFAKAVPPAIGLLGLAAIIGAVTSRLSHCLLS